MRLVPHRTPITGRAIGLSSVLTLLFVAVAPAQEAALQQAIRSFGPDMRLSDEAGLSVHADFNGDGLPDIATVLRDPNRSALAVFHSTPEGYQMHPLYTRLPEGPVELRVVDPGRHPVIARHGWVVLENPAVELIFPGRSSAMYVWQGGKYQVYGTESYH